MLPSFGSFVGRLAPRDVDWFAVDAAVVSPQCVELTASGANNMSSTLSVDTASGARDLNANVPAGMSVRLALASNDLERASFGTTAAPNDPVSGDPARPGDYSFTLTSTAAPPLLAGDAGSGMDAGGSGSGALPLSGACTGGHLGGLDHADAYAFAVSAPGYVTYSLGAAQSGVRLSVTDAGGASAAPTLLPGQAGAFYVASPGSYTFTVTSPATQVGDVEYLVGSVVSGDPPNPGCRPFCVL